MLIPVRSWKKTYSERMCIITGTQTNRERCLKNHVFTSWKRGVCIVYMYQKSQQDAWRQASGSSGTVWVTFCFEVAMAFMKMLLWHITNLSMVTVHIQHFTVIVVGSFKKNNAELHPHPQKNYFFQEYEKLLILPPNFPDLTWSEHLWEVVEIKEVKCVQAPSR